MKKGVAMRRLFSVHSMKGDYIMPQTLWDGGPILHQAPGVFPMGTDSVLLAHFAQAGKKDRVLDLGTGTGILPILLSFERPMVTVTALEQSDIACKTAKLNFIANGLSDRIALIHGDLRQHRELVKTGQYDLTVSNPPYFSCGSGPDAKSGLKNARGDGTCTLMDLCQAAAWATRWGGRFCLVFRPDRLCDLILALRETGFEPKRLRPVHHSPGEPVNLILVEARRGGNPGLIWENDFYLRDSGGNESPELQRIYRRA